jgi:hypothetical protein
MRRASPNDIPLLVGLMAEFYAEGGYDLNHACAAGAFAASGGPVYAQPLGAAYATPLPPAIRFCSLASVRKLGNTARSSARVAWWANVESAG